MNIYFAKPLRLAEDWTKLILIGTQLKPVKVNYKAYYNIDGDLFEMIDAKTIQTIKQKLKIPYFLSFALHDNSE